MLGNNTSKEVVPIIDKALIMIIALRIISGSIELTAAALMFKFNDLEKAFYINTLLALVGPVILIVTTGLALLGLAEKISLARIICLFCGISLILFSLKAS
ncbi:YqhV family protein [Solibacillus sp. FSL R5-0691]|uniref:YqhV family protein n=1 Tax=unclassified Solibacillus TaxID=2637870 RepID=UPI0030CAC6AD